ncbi:MAG TPA: 2-succinyl-5-enolpyruvyl-6-hydroxy-3-cyclohexene-1-carboxylic-acid synthase [Chlamydiales bacterium]|nr:2-succinyl-5-enolpyruvyl-6-hydroxy-3-cyclohexene-1-carboxylic-acid synthase [Chlamydiales bacterium]
MEYWIIDQLVQQGVRHFALAPGSRSTPLVTAAAAHKKAKLHVHYDERGLGFFALGLAKASLKPAAVIVTSGTAVGNLLPAVMEAHHSCTPLLLLTADRPGELRDCGANQTTDQVKIFSSFVRFQTDLSCTMNEAAFRSVLAQSHFYATQNPPGPVHINCRFREPFAIQPQPFSEGVPILTKAPRHIVPPYSIPHAKGLILIGQLPHPDDVLFILTLANRLKWPVCADILSNARCYPTPEQIKYFDWMEKPKPDIVLHFGERLTSKKILEWLKVIKPEIVHISPYPFLQNPGRILTSRIQADIPEFCHAFEAPTDPLWLSSWDDQEPQFQEGGPFTEAHAMKTLSELLPPDFALFLGNGMPIRDGDHFLFPTECRGFFANRGLSGIDGNIATIAGLAEEMPIFGIIGDQTALHDLNSLPLLKKTRYPVILLISNNFGSGMFHHLPVSQSPYFEPYWAAPHDFRFLHAAKMYDIPYFTFEQLEHVFQTGQTAIVELLTDRTANYEYQATLAKSKMTSTSPTMVTMRPLHNP